MPLVKEKTINWLTIISHAFAALQIRFLQAAMDNIKTMQENVGQSSYVQADNRYVDEFFQVVQSPIPIPLNMTNELIAKSYMAKIADFKRLRVTRQNQVYPITP